MHVSIRQSHRVQQDFVQNQKRENYTIADTLYASLRDVVWRHLTCANKREHIFAFPVGGQGARRPRWRFDCIMLVKLVEIS